MQSDGNLCLYQLTPGVNNLYATILWGKHGDTYLLLRPLFCPITVRPRIHVLLGIPNLISRSRPLHAFDELGMLSRVDG